MKSNKWDSNGLAYWAGLFTYTRGFARWGMGTPAHAETRVHGKRNRKEMREGHRPGSHLCRALWLCLPVPRRSLALLLWLSVPSTAIAAGALTAQYKKLSFFRYKNGGRLLRPTPISKVKKLFSYLTYMKHGDMMQMGILPKYEKGV